MALQNGLKVLIVEDDRDLAAVVLKALQNAGFAASTAGSGAEALRQIEADSPNLVILDLGLPDIDGIELCRQIHAEYHIPIIILTARTDETDRIVGLEVGADDYVTKPFSVKELIARVKAVLRRVQGEPARPRDMLRVGDIELDLAGHAVVVNGKPVELTRTEFLILQTLMRNAGRVVPRSQLAQAVWGTDSTDPHLLEVHVSNLRRKIEKDPRRPKHLVTVRSVGYKMV